MTMTDTPAPCAVCGRGPFELERYLAELDGGRFEVRLVESVEIKNLGEAERAAYARMPADAGVCERCYEELLLEERQRLSMPA
jgi:hypothetical protein